MCPGQQGIFFSPEAWSAETGDKFPMSRTHFYFVK